MNCLRLTCLLVFAAILLSGCKGTGILLVPSKGDIVSDKLTSSVAFLDGFWQGKYEDSKVEVEAEQDKGKDKSSGVTVWIYDKDKKQPMLPMKVFVIAVKENKYVIFLPDMEKLMKSGGYSPVSNGFLYPVMKIFKLTQAGPDKLSLQEVIFTKKDDQDKVVTLSPEMKMWGENSNMIYGTSSAIVGYLEAGQYELSKETVLTKTAEKK